MRIDRYFQSLAAVAVLALSIVGCSPPGASTTATKPLMQPQLMQPQPAHREIARLVGRHHTIIITTGPTTPLYTIETNSGQVLASNVTLSQLRQSRPDLYEDMFPNPKAGTKDGSGAIWDASIDD